MIVNLQKLLDALVFSNLWVAWAAALLSAAVSAALGAAPEPSALGLAFGGTLAVYNFDRLRFVEGDRATAPARSAFVERNRKLLGALALLGLAGAVACGLAAGRGVLALAACVLALAAAHPVLKRVPFVKAAYLSVAWLAVVVGVPAILAGGGPWGFAALTLGGALVANAIVSSLRDREGGAARVGTDAARLAALLAAAAGAAAAVAGPAALRPLAAVPLLTLGSVAAFREGERYGLTVVDGALLVGGALALVAYA